jgi:membrane protein
MRGMRPSIPARTTLRREARSHPDPIGTKPIARLIGVASAAVSRFFAAGCSQHAAGIAYRVLFSLAPLAIVLVSVFGLVLQDDDVRDAVVDRVLDALPVDATGTADVESAIEALASPTSAIGLLSLVIFLWAAAGMMAAIRKGLERAMGVDYGRPVARAKLVDLILVGAAAVLVLVSVGIGVIAELANELVARLSGALGIDGGVAETAIALGLPFLLSLVTALLLYRFVPAASLRISAALAGAVTTAVLLLGVSLASELVYAKTTDWSVIYGSLTSLLVFLYSVYLYAWALLFGAAVAAEWSLPHEASDEPLKAKIRRGVRGVFIREPRQQ